MSKKISVKLRNNVKNIDLGHFVREVSRGLDKVGNRLVESAVSELEAMDRVDQGDLKKSINYGVQLRGSSLVCKTGSNVKHGVFVHEGTKPHYPPLEPIRAWVHRKNPELRRDPETILAIARKVVKKIGKRGTSANPFLTNALKIQRNPIKRILTNSMEKGVRAINAN